MKPYFRSFGIVFIFPLLTLFFIGCQQKKNVESIPQNDVIPVTVMNIQQEGHQTVIHSSGRFTTDDETVLSFKNGGIIRKILVKEGDPVKKGQLLATLDPTEIGALNDQALVGLEKAKRDFARAQALYKDSVATLEQLQNAESALKIAQQQVTGVQFNVKTSELRSTQSGYVLQLFGREGQIVGPGTPVIMTNGANQGRWFLKSGVSDVQWSAIRVGDKAEITTDASRGQVYEATVVKKSEGIDPNSGTFQVWIEIKGKRPSHIATGLFGKVVIHASSEQKAWVLPLDVLMDSDQNSGFVFVITEEGHAKKVPVTIDRIERGKAIISHGLAEYKTIIKQGNAYLKDGSQVNIISESGLPATDTIR